MHPHSDGSCISSRCSLSPFVALHCAVLHSCPVLARQVAAALQLDVCLCCCCGADCFHEVLRNPPFFSNTPDLPTPPSIHGLAPPRVLWLIAAAAAGTRQHR